MKKFITTALFSYIYLVGFAQIDTIACNLYENNCNIGIGTRYPGEKLQLVDGNFLIEGGGETAIIMKRDITYTGGPSGTSPNPIFYSGRIIQAGDGDPEFRFLYKDDLLDDGIPIFEFDRKGIIASVKPAPPAEQYRGSHFEGFYRGAVYPYFRLNSYPHMRLEMGGGGVEDVDVAVERLSKKMLGFYTGNVCHAVIDSLGRLGIGTQTPNSQLEVNGFIHSTSLGFKFPDGTVQTTATSLWSIAGSDIYYNSGNIGIGTDVPESKLEIANGDVYISDIEKGIIMKSPNGQCWRGTLDNLGVLNFSTIDCPEIEPSTFQELKSTKEIFFYPNPTYSKITIVIKDFNQKDLIFTFYDLTGKILNRGEITSNYMTLDISQYNLGTYLLSVNDRNGAVLSSGKIIMK